MDTRHLTTARRPGTDDAIFRKVTWRFAPLLFVCYVFNYMDRTNIGFAQLQMKIDLGFSSRAYGFGAGVFFISYSLLALPSNLVMNKIGARKTISASLLGWGLISAATMLVRTPAQFYGARFLLGIVEAGFLPGVLFYLTKWYPSDRRANVTGIFLSATVVAGVLSGVLSGILMSYLNGFSGLRGWQWMFLLEGLPSALMGIGVFIYLDDDPAHAEWLTESERSTIFDCLKNDPVTTSGYHTLGQSFGDWRVYLFGLIYFLIVIDTFVLAFWQPAMIKEFGVSSIMAIGLYSTIPSIAAVIAKIWISYHSDLKKELRWHFAIPAFVGSIALSLTTCYPHSPLLGIVFLALATAGVHGCIPVFWSVPGLYLTGTAAASGLALISTVGSLSGAVGPYVLGVIESTTGRFTYGMYMQSALLALGAILLLAVVPREKKEHQL